jgi:hypothetical protein
MNKRLDSDSKLGAISMEHLSDASFLRTLLLLQANGRLDWKVIARYKHYSLFGLVISNKIKKFYNIDNRS